MNTTKFRELKLYLQALPYTLPLPDWESPVNWLLNFTLDEEWVANEGKETAVNQELEVALGDFLPRNNQGIFFIKQCGPAIEALADVLEIWVTRYPANNILMLWLRNAIDSAKKCIINNGGSLPNLSAMSSADKPSKLSTGGKSAQAKQKSSISTQQTQLSFSGQPKAKAVVQKKLDTKILENTDDPGYSTEEESDDGRSGGRKTFPLLLKTTRRCHAKGETRKLVRCLASKGCKTTWAYPRDKTILHPNPLAIPSITITRDKESQPRVQAKKDTMDSVGMSLLGLLQKEYGNEYRQGRSVDEAKKAMEDVNPYLAPYAPKEAIAALKKQFKSYVEGIEAFTHKRDEKESLREYWCRFLNDEDSGVLAALAVKIFAAMPISMVDERAMSVVTWLNSPKHRRQKVSTVSDHLAIRGFDQMNKGTPRKPVTVNWCDIHAIIDGQLQGPKKRAFDPSDDEDSADEEEKESNMDAPPDPAKKSLKWLEEGIPDLSGFDNRHFDLATQFEIARYVQVLADSVSTRQKTTKNKETSDKSQGNGQKDIDARLLVPEDNNWTTWG